MPAVVIAAAISAVGSLTTSLATQPSEPEMPKMEEPAVAAGVAEREANKRRKQVATQGRGSTLLSGSPMGLPGTAKTSANTLTGA